MKPNSHRTVRRAIFLLTVCAALVLVCCPCVRADQNKATASNGDGSAAPSKPPTLEQVAVAAVRAHFGSQPLRRRGDWAVDPNETAELNAIFEAVQRAYASIQPGPNEGAQRKVVNLELTRELEGFLQRHPASAWTGDVWLQLGRACQLPTSYSKAIQYYSRAWEVTKDSDENLAREIALEAAGPLARLLAVTGRTNQLEALRGEAQAAGEVPPSTDWNSGFDLAAWFNRHPGDAYRCGLYCLDQLARLSQLGPYDPMSVLRADASLNGFTAAELVTIGQPARMKRRTCASGLLRLCKFSFRSGIRNG